MIRRMQGLPISGGGALSSRMAGLGSCRRRIERLYRPRRGQRANNLFGSRHPSRQRGNGIFSGRVRATNITASLTLKSCEEWIVCPDQVHGVCSLID